MSDSKPAIKPYHLRLAAELLSRAADEFRRHGCHDFVLSDCGLTRDEQVAFATEAGRHNAETESETQVRIERLPYSVPDFEAMSVLAELFSEVAGLESSSEVE